MARAKVTHSSDTVHILLKGDKRNPEPSTGIIEFPGGHVEVSRCSDGSYWAHISVSDPANIIGGRIDRTNRTNAVSDMPDANSINHIALRIGEYLC